LYEYKSDPKNEVWSRTTNGYGNHYIATKEPSMMCFYEKI